MRKKTSFISCKRLCKKKKSGKVEKVYAAMGGTGAIFSEDFLDLLTVPEGIRVIGIPKTIDNDIAVTDHTPGYGSAARYIAATTHEVGEDVKSLPIHLLISPDEQLLREYQEKAKGNIRYITVSPEVLGVPEMIPVMKELGMTVAIGHSGADYDTAWKCIHNGAEAATHTFNAMKLLHQHFPAIMGAVLESDVYCEAICDGRHLHPGTVRFLIKAKGLARVVAVTFA